MADEVLRVIVAAEDQATGVLNQISKSLTDLKGTAIMAGAAIAGAFLYKSVQAFASFDEALQKSIAIMGDVDATMRKKLADAAREVARTTTVSATEAARAYYYLASAGLSAAESLEAMPTVARLAEAAAIDMAEATDYATDIMTAFGYSVQDLDYISDVLIETVRSANTDLPMLADAMKYVASVAHTAGVSIAETSAAIGLLSNAGIKGSMAGTGLRRVISELLNPSERARETLERLGITMEDLDLQTHSLADVIDLLKEKGATTADIMQIFGERGGTAMLALMEQGGGALRQFTQELENAKGATEEVAKTQEQTLNAQIKILKNNVNDLAMSVGETLVPALNLTVEALIKLFDAFNALPEPIQKLTTYAISLGSVIMVFAGIAKAITTVAGLLGAGGALASAAGALSGIASGIIAAFGAIAGAISLPIIMIGALIAAIVALIFNIGGFRDKVVSALSWVGEKFMSFAKWWAEKWLKLAEPVRQAMLAIWNVISPHLSKIVDELKEMARNVWEGIKSIFNRAAEALKEPFLKLINYITSLPGMLRAKAERIGRAIVDGIKAGLSSLWEMLKSALIDPVKNAIDAVKGVLGISSPSKVFMDIGKYIVEGYSKGLDAAKKLDVELPAPRITTMFATAGSLHETRAANVNITLNGVAIRQDEDIERLAEEISYFIGRKVKW